MNVNSINKSSLLVQIALIALMVMISQFPALSFDASAVQQGQHWRLITGFFYHLDNYQMLISITGLVLIANVCHRSLDATKLAVGTLMMAALCGLILWDIASIKSFSGFTPIVHAIWLFGALLMIRHDAIIAGLLVAGLTLKLWHEYQGQGGDLSPLFIGHCVGSLVGLLAALFVVARELYQQRYERHRGGPNTD